MNIINEFIGKHPEVKIDSTSLAELLYFMLCTNGNNDYKSIEELRDTVDNCIKHCNPTDFWHCGYNLEAVAKSSSFFDLINKVALYQHREGKYIIEGIKTKRTNIILDEYCVISLA